MRYTAIDSFSGAGGLSLGLKKAGFDVLLSFDFDEKCIETQSINKKYLDHPAIVADANKLTNGNLIKLGRIQRGELFLFAGGPPCQGFSIQRIGRDTDVRNELVYKYVELVEELLPKYFLMENVPGITGKRGKKILEVAMAKAAELGFWIHKQTLDAQDFGVPQRRRRVFVVGERKDGNPPFFQFPHPTANGKVTVRDTIGELPPPPEDGSDHPDHVHHRRDRISDLNRKRLEALDEGQGRDHLPEELLTKAHKVSSDIIGHRKVYGRMTWDDVSPTLTARFDSFTRGQFGHPEQIRSITLREGALLQTFPVDYVFSGNKVDVARQIGNAVPPKLAEILGRSIIKCEQRKQQALRQGI